MKRFRSPNRRTLVAASSGKSGTNSPRGHLYTSSRENRNSYGSRAGPDARWIPADAPPGRRACESDDNCPATAGYLP